MSESEQDSDGQNDVLPEIQDLRVEAHADLEGRVQREINRRTLTGDSLDFSLNVMLQTFWEHLRSVIDVWPGRSSVDDDQDDEPHSGK